MDIQQFLEEYAYLSPNEKTLFAEATSSLLNEGLIWREDDEKRSFYTFLTRHSTLVKNYLGVIGWEVRHYEHQFTFQVVHRDGLHRKRFSLDTTIWLLLLRLIYAERLEKLTARMTRYPTITIEELIVRYNELPGSRKYKKTSLITALSELQHLPLIRVANRGGFRALASDQVIELLPPLEVIIPAGNAEMLAQQLAEYGNPRGSQDQVEPLPEEEMVDLDLS